MGGRALLRLARTQSAPGQRLRGDNRIRNRLPLCRFRPAPHPQARPIMSSETDSEGTWASRGETWRRPRPKQGRASAALRVPGQRPAVDPETLKTVTYCFAVALAVADALQHGHHLQITDALSHALSQ